MSDIPSLAADAVQTRLAGIAGLPVEIWRNRGRLGVWKEISGVAPGAGGFSAVNVMDGDARATEWLLGHPDMEVEVEQEILVDYLVYHETDAARTALYRAGLRKIVDAVMPLVAGKRERTLGGLVDEIELDRVERQGLVLDVSPFIIGAALTFRIGFTADTVLG